MDDPPGRVPRQKSYHHRRPPAHKSVSLRRSPPAPRPSASTLDVAQSAQSSQTGPASDKANPPSSAFLEVTNKCSSGESSDAGKWFESTNNNAVQNSNSFVDNDPPFFLRNSSSSETPPEGQDFRAAHARPLSTIPYRPGLTQFDTDGSSTEDFRSVIDDLTVANKRLKQKLRKYEKLYDAHLQEEKLFEVRFHGLPDHKKKELEETLRKFAADLDDNNNENPSVSYVPALGSHQTASSTSRFAESGYASLSASGQNSMSMPSGHESGDRRKMSRSQYNRQQQSIQSYLHDIPAGLFPKHSAPMSETSKKKLIVRRLEQIFAGKRSAPGNHQQPMQQEEVAQSAAVADRRAKEATGRQSRQEGHREARIMPVQSEDEESIGAAPRVPLNSFRKLITGIGDQDFAPGSSSPDQRPTRPLDLDPHRAQVPAENMEYIRHLGFTPPNMMPEEGPQDGHGWIYLNLLINMAQLHTINVTPDFVKEAINQYSSRFELSHDGRKIRWKGCHTTSRNSESSSEPLGARSPYDLPSGSTSISPSKPIKTGNSGSSDSAADFGRQTRTVARAEKQKEQSKFVYNPIFFHKEDSDDEDGYCNLDIASSSNSLVPQQCGDSSGFASSAIRSSSSRKRHDGGPMIFYNKAKFCTDLSSDRQGLSFVNPASYKSIGAQPLGASLTPHWRTDSASAITDIRGPLNTASLDLDPRESDRTSSNEEEIGFQPEALKNDNGTESPEIMEFEASGLGGVQPDDNFAITVKRSQVQTTPSHYPKTKPARPYSRQILEALQEQSSSDERSSAQLVIKEEILSANRKTLPRSTLPPASFLPFDSTSSGDVDSDLDDDVSSRPSTSSSSDRGPDIGFPLLNISPLHPGNIHQEAEADSDEVEEDCSSDGSVDLLATARELDPRTIRADEREYDAEFAERLAEDIPAGSSAATAGGGSGFNSPISVNVPGEEGKSTQRPSNASGSTSASYSKNLKRTRTSDSIATALQQPGKSQKTSS